jgi:PKD repeat protein
MKSLKNIAIVCSVLLVLASFWVLNPVWIFDGKNARGVIFNSETKVPKKDRMDLAWLLEKELTQDPNTGDVPRERLLAAWQYQQQLIAKQGSGKAAIPGVSWTERGPNNCGGRTRTVWVDLNDATRKTIWAGGVAGGLWKTTDITAASPNWTPINEFFQNMAVTSITQAPNNPNIMYFGTGEGNGNLDAVRGLGVWKSTDGGQTWAQLSATNNSTYYYCQKILTIGNGDTLFVATRSGLQRSVNGGTSFTKVLGSGIASSGGDVAQDIERMSNGTLYASMSGTGSNTGTIHKSFNNGATWTTPLSIPAYVAKREIEIAVSVVDTNTIYGLVENSSRITAIIKSTNAGSTFDTVAAHPIDADGGVSTTANRKDFSRGQAWYDLSIAVDPNNPNVAVVGGIDLFKTANGGASWTQVSHWYGGFGFQEVHADQHFAFFSPGSSDICYFGNDGGVYRSENFTAASPTILSKETNYNTTQFYACDINPTAASNSYIAGAQDNGSHRFSTAGINATVEVTGGDGAFCHIDQDQPQFWFTSYVYTSYYRSTNTGASFSNVLNTSQNVGSFINPSDYDDVNNKMYSAGNNGTFTRWDNPQTGSSLIFDTVPLFNNGRATHVRVSPNVNHRVYFGTNGGRIIRIDNANVIAGIDSFINNGKGMPSGSISCIEIESGNENHILATYSNYGVNSVWETKNGGSTWTSVEGNLPDMPIRWLILHPSKPWQAMVATELGVWTTDSLRGTTTNWQPSNNGFANVRTDMLKMRGVDKQVVAATHARGLYTSNVFAPPFADFTANKRLAYVSAFIQFTSSSNGASSYLWDFGDGTTSTLANPQKQYLTPGIYNVSLTINGGANTKLVNSYIQILPYRQVPYTLALGGNFDSNPNDFGAETPSGVAFARGSSTVASKSGTASGSFAWVTGITGNYADNNDTRLYSPCFNFTASGTYTIRFKTKNRFEIGYDGYIVEYSLNLGNTWTKLGNAVQANWYDFANTAGGAAFALNQPFFNATRTSYTLMQYNVSSLAGNSKVSFRIVFKADGGVTDAGMAVDDFEITGPTNSALPVNLISFWGKRQSASQVDLHFRTASEKNNKGFEIWRSTDGFNFNKIGFVAGAGNSQTNQTYYFQDLEAPQDQLYYRLKQIDEDGRFEFSSIIKVEKEAVSPNLFTLQYAGLGFGLNLNVYASQAVKGNLYAQNGQLIRTISLVSGMQQLDMNDLPKGIYLLEVSDVSGHKQVEKVLWFY